MKTIFFTGLLTLLAVQCTFAYYNNGTSSQLSSNEEKFVVQLLEEKIQNIWARFNGKENENSFIGRCFGVARKLKFVMPMIIFKLGVIITVLAFLTIFSLKSLALLGLLLLINVSGAISKISAVLVGKHDTKPWRPPQNVHFHVHQGKEGNYFVDHGHTASGWDDKLSESIPEDNLGTAESYNLYYKLNKDSLLKSYLADKSL